jgi:hypothetical protein
MNDPKEAAVKGVGDVIDALGIKNVPPGEVEAIAAAVLGLVDVLGNSAAKRAELAGKAAADKIATPADAEAAASERT